MSALSISVPYPVFSGQDGLPLDNGYVWIGTANLYPITNQIAVYFDEALTIQATQPLRTINGFISNAGTPAQVYVNAVNFSIVVQDSKGSMVYNFPEATGIEPNASGISFIGFKGQVGFVSDLADDDGSDWIGFEPAGLGAVARSAQDKLRDNISVQDFGAVGNGTTNDTTAIQAAIDALPTGQTLNGLGRTYLVTNTLNLKANMTLENFVFDFSTANNSGELLNALGFIGNEIAISTGLTVGQITFTVADGSGFAAGDYVYIKSSDFWDNWDDLCIMAETHRVKTVLGNSITLFDPILYAMPTSPKIQKLTTLDNLTLRNIRAFGSGAGALGDQEGARLSYCKNLLLDNCNFIKFDDRCIRLSTCIDFTITNGIYGQANKTGLSYGVAIANASINGKISNNTFFDCRHGVTLGDDAGPNRYIVVDGNNFTLCREAGIDAHTAADLCVISNNTFQCDPASTFSDGILWRSVNVTISGNTIIDPGRHGINVRNNITNSLTGATSNYVINGNLILRCKSRGITIEKQHEGNIDNIIINGNTIKNSNNALDFGILVTSDTGYTNVFKNCVITNNAIADVAYRAIVVSVGDVTSTLTGLIISNNIINTTTYDRGIQVSATTDSNISKISITGNVINGTGTFGIRGANEEDIVVIGNVIKTATTPILLTATNNVNANNLT